MVCQPAERDSLRPAASEQPREKSGEGSSRIELGVPVRPDDHHPAAVDAFGEIAQQQHGGFIGPLQVVEDDQERLVALHPGQEAVDGLEQLLTHLVRSDLMSGCHAAHLLSKAGRQGGKQLAVVAGGFLQGPGRRCRDPGCEHLAERRIGLRVVFKAAPAQDEPAPGD